MTLACVDHRLRAVFPYYSAFLGAREVGHPVSDSFRGAKIKLAITY